MSFKERDKIEARLRKEQDADLRNAIAGIGGGELSEMVRDGLRLMLGIRTKKSTQIVEQPIAAAPNTTRPVQVSSKSAVWQPGGAHHVKR